MPRKSPSPSTRGKSQSPSPRRKSTSAKNSSSTPRSRKSLSKSPSLSRKKSAHGDKTASPDRPSTSAKVKKSASRSSSAEESAPTSASKPKNVVIKSPELTERGLKILDYSSQGMTVIPSSLLNRNDVGVLILASNNLRSLPVEVKHMKSLIKLDINRNGIRCTHPGDFSGLPQELELLTGLEELKISECNLPYVPPVIWRLKQLKSLDLSRNKINILPPDVGNLTELKRINLQQTSITSLPPEMAYCQELEEILLWGNSIETLPDTLPEMPKLRVLALNYRSFCGAVDPYMENLLRKRQINSEHIPVVVFELPALEVLDLESTKMNNLPDVFNFGLREFYLCHNFLQSIPPTIYNLRHLQVLDMSYNLLMTLPEDIGHLSSLKVLRLNNNNFERVPPTIGHLENLQELNMSKNRIHHLPPDIRGLTELRTLLLEDNDLQALPDEICELTKLETLDVTNNSIGKLPMKLYQLLNLKYAHSFRKLSKHGLWLHGNPLEQPPPEIWRTEKPENIYNYLKKLLIINTENLQRQKILVLGNSQAGKTSLVRVLAQGKSLLTQPMLDCTRLLEQTPCKTENNVVFMLNDFGGDEVYQIMHHLFLDRKALAMIVFEENNFCEAEYHKMIGRWLQMLTSYTPDVVVKLVGTKCDLLKCSEKRISNQSKDVSKLVHCHLRDYQSQLQGELEAIHKDLTKFKNEQELNEIQQSVQKMLQTRMERLNNILACPIRIIPNISSVSATHSLEGIRELIIELEHLAIDSTMFPHAQRKVPQHWSEFQAKLKLQEGYYLIWDQVAQTAAPFGVSDAELQECVQYFCDTGNVLWYRSIPGLSEILFHRPRILVELLSSLYRHDIKDFLQYPENKILFSKGHVTQQGFNIMRNLFLEYGQVSRPLLNCLWFHQKMSEDTITDLLELLPLLNLCYTIPEPDIPATLLYERPLLVLPFYNQDTNLAPLEEVWPQTAPLNEKTLKVVYYFPVLFPFGVFQQISTIVQSMVMTRMDWRDVIYATTEMEKLLLWMNHDKSNQNEVLMMAVRGTNLSQIQNLMQELMEKVTELFKQFPGLYWKVDVQGSSTDSFIKVI